jgi:chromosome segregation ATPase
MKEDYDALRKERMISSEIYERRLYELSEENKDLKAELSNFNKNKQNCDQATNNLESEVQVLKKRILKTEEENVVLKSNDAALKSSIVEKSQRIDQYATEITSINRKILEFNDLMEKLIQENKKLSVSVSEYEKKDRFVAKHDGELQKVV